MAKTIRLGPFTEPQINEIKAKIDPLGHPYKIEIDQELVAKYQKEIANKAYYERYKDPVTALGEFLFIEVNNESLLVIKKYLHELGISLNEGSQFLPDIENYCPKCDYVTHDLTLCPAHRLPLVDYFTKVRLEKQSLPKRFWGPNAVLIVMAILLLIAFAIENFI